MLRAAVRLAFLEARERKAELTRENSHELIAPVAIEASRASASPSAHDQLYALALQADDSASEGALLGRLLSPAEIVQQMMLRRSVFRGWGAETMKLDISGAITSEERRGLRRGRLNGGYDLSAHLRGAAALNRALWDHPCLAADRRVRASMLAAASVLEARAELLVLSASSRTAVRSRRNSSMQAATHR